MGLRERLALSMRRRKLKTTERGSRGKVIPLMVWLTMSSRKSLLDEIAWSE